MDLDAKQVEQIESLTLSTEFRRSRHIEWDELEEKASKLLSIILERRIIVETIREDFCFWRFKVANTTLSKMDMEKLFSKLCAHEVNCESKSLFDLETELFQLLESKFGDLVLPFVMVESFADDNGVWFLSDETKLFFFTMKVQNRSGRQIATKTGVVYAKDDIEASEKAWKKFGGGTSYALEVWEIKGDAESFCAYWNLSGI